MENTNTINMLNNYELTTAAKKTALVFSLEKRVYMALLDTIPAALIKTDFKVDENGDLQPRLRLSMNQLSKLRLRDKGAALLGTVEEFFEDFDKTHENKGNYVERKVIERYHGIASPVNTPYYMAGDAIIASEQIQIKYENGTLATYETIMKAMEEKKG